MDWLAQESKGIAYASDEDQNADSRGAVGPSVSAPSQNHDGEDYEEQEDMEVCNLTHFIC